MVGVPIGGRIRKGAGNGGSEGWSRGPPCALPRYHARPTSSGPHRHRIPGALVELPRGTLDQGLSIES